MHNMKEIPTSFYGHNWSDDDFDSENTYATNAAARGCGKPAVRQKVFPKSFNEDVNFFNLSETDHPKVL